MKAKAMAAILGVAIIAAILMHLFDQRRFESTENRDRALLAQQQEQAKADRNQSIFALNARDLEIAKLRKEVSDLARLRNEITQLRQEKRASAQLRDPSFATDAALPAGAIEPGKYISREQVAFAGYATPEAAVQSMMWASIAGNFEAVTNSYHPAVFAVYPEGRSSDLLLNRARFEAASRTNSLLKGLQILARKDVQGGAVEAVELKVMFDLDPSAGPLAGRQTNVVGVIKDGDDWKFLGVMNKGAGWENYGTVQKFVP